MGRPKKKLDQIARWEFSYKVCEKASEELEYRSLLNREFVGQFLHDKLKDLPFERVAVVALDAQNKPIGYIVQDGWVDSCNVNMKSALCFLITSGAVSCVLAHNHPSGSPDFSGADQRLTERLMTALKAIDIVFLDHVLVTKTRTISMREETGLWKS